MESIVFLKKQADFEGFRRSKLVVGKALRIRIRKIFDQNLRRFGFIIPKKILPKVTDRNRVKRRIKSLLLKHITTIPAADYLIFPNKAALRTNSLELEKELLSLISSQTRNAQLSRKN
jgi:ribonuclease P protein component